MRNRKNMGGCSAARLLCVLLVCAMLTGALVSCSSGSEIPDGYQYATCKGEYFRLFVPTQWTVNTESGVSGAHYLLDGTAVSMAEVHFEKPVAEGETGEGTTATLEDFFTAHKADLTRLMNYTPEKEFDSTLGSYRAKDITYTATVGGVDYRYRQVLTKVEGRFYLFTFTSPVDSFDQWSDTVEGILEEVLFYAVPYEGNADEKKIPKVDNIPEGMKLVSDNDVPYRFFAPDDWAVDGGSAACTVYVSEEDRSNVSVIGYVPEVDKYSVADYWEMCEKYYKDALDDYTLTAEPVEATMGGRKATVYEYTYSLGGVDYKTRQAICAYSDMIVVMTYTALPENYDAHLADVEAMQGALTFRR